MSLTKEPMYTIDYFAEVFDVQVTQRSGYYTPHTWQGLLTLAKRAWHKEYGEDNPIKLRMCPVFNKMRPAFPLSFLKEAIKGTRYYMGDLAGDDTD